MREKEVEKNPGSLCKTSYQVPEEEHKNLDNIMSSHLFEVPGKYQDCFSSQ